MTWAKVDDRTHEDPRTEAAGVEAMGLWALALSYMAAHRTDGRITVARCRHLAGAQKGKRYADKLVAAGWWTAEGPDAYRLVEWERLLLPRTAVEERSARAVEAGRKGGEAKAARARAAADEGPKVEPRSGVRSGVSLPPNPEPCSGSLDANSAKEKERALPTPAHDPDPTRPVSETAHARDDVQAYVRETVRAADDRQEGGAKGTGVTVGQIADPALPGLGPLFDQKTGKKAPAPPKGEHPYSAAWVRGHAAANNGGPIMPLPKSAIDTIGRACATHARDLRTKEPITGAALHTWIEHRVKDFREANPDAKRVRGGWTAWGFATWLDEQRPEDLHDAEVLAPRIDPSKQAPRWKPPKLSPEEQQRVLDQYFPGVYTKKAAANG